ncbi:melanocortin-2 receptor accessory protein 2 isoform X1 [Anolis sagrei]|uniref:melanocortin-2 receptor accessory protein 2 isoform X1 n=2 Tax=Anolis sagrei TaxID=38937 RepID=UPI003522A68A
MPGIRRSGPGGRKEGRKETQAGQRWLDLGLFPTEHPMRYHQIPITLGSMNIMNMSQFPLKTSRLINVNSIVIGFWVGLAVFVIFMFFVLTLLTKTGASHQENTDPAEKRLCMNNFVADFGRPLDSNRIFSQQVAEESRLLFNCYINELENVGAKPCPKVPVTDSNIHFQEVMHNRARLEEELHCHTKFNIPNFVNTDQSSLGEDDLLISEPPIILENKPVSHASHYIPD